MALDNTVVYISLAQFENNPGASGTGWTKTTTTSFVIVEDYSSNNNINMTGRVVRQKFRNYSYSNFCVLGSVCTTTTFTKHT